MIETREEDFGRRDEPDIIGCALLSPDGASGEIVLRPGSTPEDHAAATDWLLERQERFLRHGPEPDGWQLRESDGWYQLWVRLVHLPTLDL